MKVKEFELLVVLRMLGVGERRDPIFERKDRSGREKEVGAWGWGWEIKWSQKG